MQIQQLQQDQVRPSSHIPHLSHSLHQALDMTTDTLPPTGSVLDTQVLQTSDNNQQEISSDLLEELRQQMASGDDSLLRRMVPPELMESSTGTEDFTDGTTDIDSLARGMLDTEHRETTVVELPAEFGPEEGSPDNAGGGHIHAFRSTSLSLTHRGKTN